MSHSLNLVLLTLIIVPYMIPYITPLEEFRLWLIWTESRPPSQSMQDTRGWFEIDYYYAQGSASSVSAGRNDDIPILQVLGKTGPELKEHIKNFYTSARQAKGVIRLRFFFHRLIEPFFKQFAKGPGVTAGLCQNGLESKVCSPSHRHIAMDVLASAGLDLTKY